MTARRSTLALAAALLLGACGSGDDAGDDSAATSSTGVTIGIGDAPVGPAVPGATSTTVVRGRQANAPWTAPTRNVSSLIARAGLPALPGERLEYHIHAHIDVFVDGKKHPVPANLGIDIEKQAISPLHTHDDSGIIHVENDKPTDFFLGQLFTEWDIRLDATCIGAYCRPDKPWDIYLDGTRDTGDPRRIQFTRHRQIAIVIGTPPGSIPSTYEWPSGV